MRCFKRVRYDENHNLGEKINENVFCIPSYLFSSENLFLLCVVVLNNIDFYPEKFLRNMKLWEKTVELILEELIKVFNSEDFILGLKVKYLSLKNTCKIADNILLILRRDKKFIREISRHILSFY